jgi:hypothetical protein
VFGVFFGLRRECCRFLFCGLRRNVRFRDGRLHHGRWDRRGFNGCGHELGDGCGLGFGHRRRHGFDDRFRRGGWRFRLGLGVAPERVDVHRNDRFRGNDWFLRNNRRRRHHGLFEWRRVDVRVFARLRVVGDGFDLLGFIQCETDAGVQVVDRGVLVFRVRVEVEVDFKRRMIRIGIGLEIVESVTVGSVARLVAAVRVAVGGRELAVLIETIDRRRLEIGLLLLFDEFDERAPAPFEAERPCEFANVDERVIGGGVGTSARKR